MKKMNLKYGLVALMGLGLSANVSAADLTCNDIEFTPEAFAAYQYADQACLDVVERDGGMFAKFTATKVVPPDLSPGVSNFIRFKHNDGTTGARHKSNLPRNFQVYLDKRPVRLADVNAGQDLNIYVGQEYWVSLAMVEEIVEEAIVAEMVEEAIVEEMIEEEMEAELPTTAGPLPWLALFGSLFLILGGALRFSRKQ
ncbi:MAG: hypothetical protein WBM36_00150 [Lysobacterales bacterium]